MKKIYLNTVEEITKALSEGKVIYEVEAKNPEQKYFKHWIINGIVISKFIAGFSDYSTYIGRQFSVDADTIFYYKEEEPLKFEWGKFYKTETGKKVLLAFISDIVMAFTSTEGRIYRTNLAGEAEEKDKNCPDEDIVDYWEEQNGNN